MTRVILKYVLDGPEATIRMPHGARMLTARLQRGEICLWAEVDVCGPTVARTFVSINTGADFDPRYLRYIATDESSNGVVWHVYEKEKV